MTTVPEYLRYYTKHYPWWEDRDLLAKYNIDSRCDYRYRGWEFMRELAVDGRVIKQYQMMDEDVLHHGHFRLEDLISRFDAQIKEDDDYIHPGPTTAELKDPRIKEAYEAMNILRRLIR